VAREADKIIRLEQAGDVSDLTVEQALKVGKLAASLRPYYAKTLSLALCCSLEFQ